MIEVPTCGIYSIVCNANGNSYIGSSKNIEKRWKKHKWELSKGIHHSSRLQRSWLKYGDSKFEFMVIESSSATGLFRLEQDYLDTFSPAFNMAKVAGTCAGVKRSPAECAAISERMKQLSPSEVKSRHDKMRATMATPEFRKRRSETAKRALADPVIREAMLLRMATMHAKAEYREAVNKGLRASFLRPERKAAIKAAAANRGVGTNWRTKHAEGNRARRSVPDDTVRTILRLRADGVGATEIGNRTGVKLSSVKNIIHGNSYKDVCL